MPFVIFEVKNPDIAKIQDLLKDDITSRQSIVIRDAKALGIKEDVTYVQIEGSPEGVKHAETIAKELGFATVPEKKAKEINDKITQEEKEAATGMGMIFD
jgi:hypothetical protein